MTEALDSLAQVATDQLFGFDTASLLTPQFARHVPQLSAEDFSLVQAGMDETTNIFGEPVDFHDTSVPGISQTPTFRISCSIEVLIFGSTLAFHEFLSFAFALSLFVPALHYSDSNFRNIFTKFEDERRVSVLIFRFLNMSNLSCVSIHFSSYINHHLCLILIFLGFSRVASVTDFNLIFLSSFLRRPWFRLHRAWCKARGIEHSQDLPTTPGALQGTKSAGCCFATKCLYPSS